MILYCIVLCFSDDEGSDDEDDEVEEGEVEEEEEVSRWMSQIKTEDGR